MQKTFFRLRVSAAIHPRRTSLLLRESVGRFFPPSLCRHSRSVFTTFLSFSHILPLRPRARARRRRGGNSQSTGNENRIGGRGRRGEEEGDDVNRRAPKEEEERVERTRNIWAERYCVVDPKLPDDSSWMREAQFPIANKALPVFFL